MFQSARKLERDSDKIIKLTVSIYGLKLCRRNAIGIGLAPVLNLILALIYNGP